MRAYAVRLLRLRRIEFSVHTGFRSAAQRNHFPNATKLSWNGALAWCTRSNNGVRSCWPSSSTRSIAKCLGPPCPECASSPPT